MTQKLRQLIVGKKLAKETMWSFAAKAITFLLYIAIDVALARSLGDQYGLWSYFFSTISILVILSRFGIDSSLKTFVAQYNGTDTLRTIARTGFGLRVLFSAAAIVALFFLREHVAELLDRQEFAQLLVLGLPLIFFTNMVNFFTQFFSGIHRVKYQFYNAVVEYGTKLALVLVVALVPAYIASVASAILAFSVGVVLASAVSGFFAARYVRKNTQPVAATEKKSYTGDILRYSVPLFFISIGFVIATEVDTVLLGLLSGDEAAGVYAVSKKLIVKLPQISLAIAIGTMPVFAKMTADTVPQMRALFSKLVRINSFIFLPIAAIILATSWFFIPLLYGEAFTASVLPMNILVVYLLTYSYSIYLSTFLDYRKRATKRAMNLVVAIVLNIVLDIVLIPTYGPAGAAAATSLSYLPYLLLNWREVRMEFKRTATQQS